MGLFDVKHFIDRIKALIPVDDVVGALEKLPIDEISQNAGTYGGIFKIALLITEKAYQNVVPVEKRLSLILMRIMIQSAEDSFPYSVSSIKIDDIFSKEKTSDEFGDIVLKIFDSKYFANKVTIVDILDHPVFDKFRDLLKFGLEKHNEKYEPKVNIPLFVTEFNWKLLTNLKEEESKNKDLQNLLQKWEVNTGFLKLTSYLDNATKPFLKPRGIYDDKPLLEYYVENQTYIVSKDTWDRAEAGIKEKEEWHLNSFLSSNDSLAIIAAPFGIGKSSLAKKMAHDCATRYIADPTDGKAFIPVLVPLKFAFEKTSNNNSLDNDLKNITSFSPREKDTNILAILDGLDELPEDRRINIKNIYDEIQGLVGAYPSCKFIVTTRLEAGFPARLNIEESYVRLFSFNENQIMEFFEKYDLLNDYKGIQSILSKEKLGKPLFCWMIAAVYNNSSDAEKEILFGQQKKDYLGEIFLYQQFIHNVIFGKPKEEVRKEFEERSTDEKEALRLIAFLKNEKPYFSKDEIASYLDALKFQLPKSAKSLLTTYFSISKDDQGKDKVEFTHKSFQEYLLAEFYFQSISDAKCHRLIGSEPSRETYSFMNSFIKLLTDSDPRIREYSENFIKSFNKDGGNNDVVGLDNYVKRLRNNSIKYLTQNDLVPILPEEEPPIWDFTRLEYGNLRKLWVSRWITAYIAGNLLNENTPIDDDFLESASFFISNCSRLIHNKDLRSAYLKGIRLDGVDLTQATLANANLTQATLANANLTQATLANANLTQANLPNANLTGANLGGAILTGAILTGANLGGANLTGASLCHATLYIARGVNTSLNNANLTNAEISGDFSSAHLRNANLTQAHLMEADLLFAYADLSEANLTNAMFTGAILTGAILTGANLTNANFVQADFSNAHLDKANLNKASLMNANLMNADLTNANLMNANLTNANLMNANLTNANLMNANLSNACLSYSILVNPSGYTDSIVNSDTNFSGCVTDKADLIRYLDENKVQALPHEIKDKSELGKRLYERSRTPGIGARSIGI